MAVLFILADCASAKTLFVSRMGNDSDGLSWESGFHKIAAAINSASEGDQIWIRQDDYFESLHLKDDIHLIGGFAGTESQEEFNLRDSLAHPTIINASGTGKPVVTAGNHGSLEGLILKGGVAGLRCSGVTFDVTSCVIAENESDLILSELSSARLIRAEIFGVGVQSVGSTLRFTDVHVRDNSAAARADAPLAIATAVGAGVYIRDSTFVADSIRIEGNRVEARSENEDIIPASALGAGLYADKDSRVELIYSRIGGNKASGRGDNAQVFGAGLYIQDDSTLRLEGCLLLENTHEVDGKFVTASGGAAVASRGNARSHLTNVLIARNRIESKGKVDPFENVELRGGGIDAGAGTFLSLVNVTVAHNAIVTSSTSLSGASIHEATLVCLNSIIWNGTQSVVADASSVVTVIYSDIEGGVDGIGNLDADPLFLNPDEMDYRLDALSPCIDSGATEGPALDIEGTARPIDVPAVGRDSSGDEYDMGAYERGAGILPTWTPTHTPTQTFTPTPTITPTSTPLPRFTTLYVDHRASESGEGSSWETAFRTVNEALVHSVSGDQIWVAGGVYYASHQLHDGVDLFGGFSGTELPDEFQLRDWIAHPTVLSGSGLLGAVVMGADDVTLDGFRIEEGEARFGGGLYCSGANMRLLNIVFRNNLARHVVPYAASSFASSGGGGIHSERSNLYLENCTFDSNVSSAGASADFRAGASTRGGAISVTEGSTVVCDRCIFVRNRCSSTAQHSTLGAGALARGGAIYSSGASRITLANCLFTDQYISAWGDGVDLDGGAVYTSDGEISMIHCTVSGNNHEGNFHPRAGDGVTMAAGSVRNSIIWDGTNSLVILPSGTTQVTYSNIQSGIEGEGNLESDPKFVDAESGDYRLRPDSPCADSASIEGLLKDLLGNPRPVDVVGRGFEGNNAYDMGCYEFQLSPADLDANGVIDMLDLFIFQNEWMKEGDSGD